MGKDHCFHHAFERIQKYVVVYDSTIVHLMYHAHKDSLMYMEFLEDDKNYKVIRVPKKHFVINNKNFLNTFFNTILASICIARDEKYNKISSCGKR